MQAKRRSNPAGIGGIGTELVIRCAIDLLGSATLIADGASIGDFLAVLIEVARLSVLVDDHDIVLLMVDYR